MFIVACDFVKWFSSSLAIHANSLISISFVFSSILIGWYQFVLPGQICRRFADFERFLNSDSSEVCMLWSIVSAAMSRIQLSTWYSFVPQLVGVLFVFVLSTKRTLCHFLLVCMTPSKIDFIVRQKNGQHFDIRWICCGHCKMCAAIHEEGRRLCIG